MRNKRLFCGLLFLLSALQSYCAVDMKDTIHIPLVEVISPRISFYSEGNKQEQFTVKQLKTFDINSLSELLQNETPLQLATYGTAGAQSNLSLRGAGADHTQVNWNGFPITSSTAGSTDLSFVPVAGFNNISIVNNASGALYGSGTFGGALNLDNQASWSDPGFHARLSSGYGSMNSFMGDAAIQYSTQKLQIQSSTFGTSSDGDFKYFDLYRQLEFRRKNASWTNYGTIDNVYYKLGKSSQLDGGIWYQVKDLNLPKIMGSSATTIENQKDSTLKAFVRYKTYGNASGLEIKSAYFYDYQLYTEKETPTSMVYDQYSKIITHQYFLDADYRQFFTADLSFDYGVTLSYVNADVAAYLKRKEETDFAAFLAGKYKTSDFTGNVAIRKEWNTSFSSRFLFSASGIYTLDEDNHWKVRANISQKFNKPTFNELFWVPGGNPDLKPESGYSAETGLVASDVFSSKDNEVDFDVNAYFSDIKNMISWQPAGSIWTPVNYMQVYAKGLELKATEKLPVGAFIINNTASLYINKSTVEETTDQNVDEKGHDVFYMPRYNSLISTQWTLNNTSAGIYYHYTSSRYYNITSKMDPYQLVDFQVGHNFKLAKMDTQLLFRVDNLLDKAYQVVRSYPMPGRTFSLKLGIQFL